MNKHPFHLKGGEFGYLVILRRRRTVILRSPDFNKEG
jgi:hypothetical protein